jgi:hypothetical protein
MPNRKAGVSRSRSLPRQRSERRGGRTSHSNLKRRTKCQSTALWLSASRIPPLPAATTPSNASSTCYRGPSHIHRYRVPPTLTSVSLAPSFDVSPFSTLAIRRWLRTTTTAVLRSQEKSPGRASTTRHSSFSKSASGSLRTELKHSSQPSSSRISTSAFNIPTARAVASCPTSTTAPPPPPPQFGTTAQKTTYGGRSFFSASSPWTTVSRRSGWHASTCAAASRSKAQIYARRRRFTSRPQGKEKPYMEANRGLFPWQELWYSASSLLHKVESKDDGLDR